jgi:hypothetical protein
MPTLFLSFTTLLGLIARGEISQSALDSGLFYFGCGKAHVFGEPEEAKWFEGGEAALATVRAAVTLAENNGRVLWRGQRNTWEDLQSLLGANGISVNFESWATYTYYDAERQLAGMVRVVR